MTGRKPLQSYVDEAEAIARSVLKPGDPVPAQPGFVVGECGHRLAASEWAAGYRNCERCGERDRDEGVSG